MQYIYFGTVFAAMIVFLLSSLALFSQRKKGERSRMIFACVNLLSVFNYFNVLLAFDETPAPFTVMPMNYLLISVIVVSTYIIYPIEVISPGWITWKRGLKIYTPALCLILFYKITQWMGVEYTSFKSTAELIRNIGSFEVLFRIVLALFAFLPAVLLYFVPYTHKYNNTNSQWMRNYVTIVIINDAAFLIALNSENITVRTLYYLVSVSCSLFLVYQELFVRLIRKPKEVLLIELDDEIDVEPEVKTGIKAIHDAPQASPLFTKLEQHINRTQAWRNPDLSVDELTTALSTNRTYLREAIQQQGYEGYSVYINTKRIAEFIRIIEQQKGGNYTQAFFDVGFRSKATALRNFRESTGMTPSEYFLKPTDRETTN